MGFTAVATALAATAGATVYSASQTKKAGEQQAAATAQAAEDNSAAIAAQAEKDRAAAAQAQAAQFEFEQKRDADTALTQQNLITTSATPTVQLAAQGAEGSADAARKRRATFRPEYATGVTV